MQQLVFVYNANSGLLNLGKDVLHKLVSPTTYPCKLCDLTYGVMSEKREWVACRKRLPLKQLYLHKDEFQERYGSRSERLPAVFFENAGQLEVLIGAKEMDRMDSLNEFIRVLEQRIQDLRAKGSLGEG